MDDSIRRNTTGKVFTVSSLSLPAFNKSYDPDKLFADVVIRLAEHETSVPNDPEKILSLHCHRFFLAKIPYFYNLFTFAGALSKREFTLEVEDPYIAADFIHLLYGEEVEYRDQYPAWLYALRMLRLKDYFNLSLEEQDLDLLCSLDIPLGKEEIEYLLQTLDSLGLLASEAVSKNWKLKEFFREKIPGEIKENLPEELKRNVDKKDTYIVRAVGRIIQLLDSEYNIVKTLESHTDDSVYIVEISPDGKYLISVSDDHKISVWNMSYILGERDSLPVFIFTLSEDIDCVNSVNFLPDGEHFFSTSHSGSIVLWNYKTGNMDCSIKINESSILDMKILPDGKHLLSASQEGTIKMFNYTFKELSDLKKKNKIVHTYHPSSDENILYIEICPDNKHFLSLSEDGEILLWNWKKVEKEPVSITAEESDIEYFRVLPDRAHFLAGLNKGTIVLWDYMDNKEIRRYSGHTGRIYFIQPLPDGKRFFSSSSDKTIKLWDLDSGECLRTEKFSKICERMALCEI